MKITLPLKATLVAAFFLFFFRTASFSQITADFVADVTTGCGPLTVNFTSTSTGSILVWEWDFGDGSPLVSMENPSHVFTTPGTYTVSLHCGSFNGQDDEVKIDFITVLDPPTAHFTVSEHEICSGDTISFTDTSIPGGSPLVGQQWNFNDGSSPQIGLFVDHSYFNLATGVVAFYPTMSTVDVGGCSDVFMDTIFVSPTPSVSFEVDSFSSGGAPVTVYFSNASIGLPYYSWDFGDPSSGVNNTSSLENPSHTYNALGTYTVSLAIGIAGCDAQGSISVDLFSIGVDGLTPDNRFIIYPNPASDHISIEFEKPSASDGSLAIYNLLGERVHHATFSQGQNKLVADIFLLSQGIYVVEIMSGEYRSRNKIVVE